MSIKSRKSKLIDFDVPILVEAQILIDEIVVGLITDDLFYISNSIEYINSLYSDPLVRYNIVKSLIEYLKSTNKFIPEELNSSMANPNDYFNTNRILEIENEYNSDQYYSIYTECDMTEREVCAKKILINLKHHEHEKGSPIRKALITKDGIKHCAQRANLHDAYVNELYAALSELGWILQEYGNDRMYLLIRHDMFKEDRDLIPIIYDINDEDVENIYTDLMGKG